MKPKEIQQVVYTPFDRLRYILSDTLTEDERIAISNVTRRHHYLRETNPEPSLLKPLIDIAALSGLSTEIINKALWAMLLKTHEENLPCWKWPLSIWEKLLSQHRLSGPLIAAFAYHLGPIQQPLNLPRCRQSILYACAIYGHDIVHFELNRLMNVLTTLGYSSQHQERTLSTVLGTLILENGDPRLETFTEALLKQGQAHRTEGIARAIGKVSHGLSSMGILEKPLRMRGYLGWKEKKTEGIAPEWVYWCQRWRDTSVLRPRTRETNYSFILRIGLWLAKEQAHISEPKDWTMSTCASFIAALNKITVDEWSLDPIETRRVSPRSGQLMKSNSRSCFLYALRRFFIDYELWGGTIKHTPISPFSTS